MLGAVIPDLLFLGAHPTVALGSSLRPGWFLAVLAATALVVAIQVTSWVLRLTLVAFAVARLISIPSVAGVSPMASIIVTVMNGLFACGLIVTTWRRASLVTRIVTILLLASTAAVRVWLRTSSSVFG